MGNKINNFVQSRLFVIVLIGVLLLTTILAGTYAWFTWSSTNNTVYNMTIGEIVNVTFEGGNAITGNLDPVFNYTDGLSTSFSINNRTPSTEKVFYGIKFNITSIDPALSDNASEIKYAILKDGNILEEGDLTGAANNKTIILYSGELDKGITEYVIYLYIDGNVENDISMMGKILTGNIIVIEEGSLTNHIMNLYFKNKNTNPVVNNNISYGYASIYDKDNDNNTSGGLMNDRQGTMSVSEDAGNIRYYGLEPNNYIYFNCDNYSSQSNSTCETWRIIGVFDGKVKIMRNESIGGLSWDQDKNNGNGQITYNNDWSNSSLQQFLNGKYYDRGTNATWTYYTGSNGSSSVIIDLEKNGIKNEKTRGLISESTWYLKGWDDFAIYSDQMYDYERKSGNVSIADQPTTLLRNIGLPYVSDYGYAVDFGSCNLKLNQYHNTNCKNVNWMKKNFTSYTWVIAPAPKFDHASYISLNGHAYYSNIVYDGFDVFPVLYLNPKLDIEAGDGSVDNPYKLFVY